MVLWLSITTLINCVCYNNSKKVVFFFSKKEKKKLTNPLLCYVLSTKWQLKKASN